MNNYYNYIIGYEILPNFDVEDPDNDKFDEFIKKVSKNHEHLFNNTQNRENMKNLYIALVESDFLYTYLLLDITIINLEDKKKKENFKESMSFDIITETVFNFRHVTPVEKEEYIERLKRIHFIRQFLSIEYKQHEDESYGSLDTIISQLQNDILASLHRGPIERWTRTYKRERVHLSR